MLVRLREEIGGTVFGRRRWRTPWSSGTSGKPWSVGAAGPTWASKTTRSPGVQHSLAPGEPTVHIDDQSQGAPVAAETPAATPSGAADTPTVRVIRPVVTASDGPATAPAKAGARAATPLAVADELPGRIRSPGPANPPRTRVIRIPASIGAANPEDPAADSGGAQSAGRRAWLALATREAPSVDAPAWERGGTGRPGRIASVVIAVVIVCALLGGLAAFAATLGGAATSTPGPAASIAPGSATVPAGTPGSG